MLVHGQYDVNFLIRAKNTHFKTMCERTSDNSPTDSSLCCLNWWSSKKRVEITINAQLFLTARSMSQHIVKHVFPYRKTTLQITWDNPNQVIFQLPNRKKWFKHFLILVQSCHIWCSFTYIHVENIPQTWLRNDLGWSTSFFEHSATCGSCSSFSCIFCVNHVYGQTKRLFILHTKCHGFVNVFCPWFWPCLS